MADQEILDSTINNKQYKQLLLALRWWEKKRLVFNIIVGVVGFLGLGLVSVRMFPIEFAGIIFWGLFLNLCYSLGFLFEVFDAYYFKGKLRLYRFRLIFFIVGTLSAVLVTFLGSILLPVPLFI